MKTRLFSLSGAVALSFAHLLVEMWRGFNDFSFYYPEDFGSSALPLAAAVYTLVFAFWLVGLVNGRQGKRGGILTALVVGALFWLGIDLGTLLFYCPGGLFRCRVKRRRLGGAGRRRAGALWPGE